MRPISLSFLAVAPLALWACSSTPLPVEPPPLAGMEEPLELMGEPSDDLEHAPRGSFTGIEAGDARTTLDALAGEPDGVLVTAVIENSPADAAGIEPGDLVLEVLGTPPTALHWPSEWRRLEEETPPQSELRLLVDRAGSEREARLVTEKRLRPHGAVASERFREERRAGVVLRTATHVEAAAAALGAGGGAVVVGLTRESPWRSAGLRYRDVIRAVGSVEVAHPQVLLEAIRAAPEGGSLQLEVVRAGGEVLSLDAPLSRREQELKEVSIPLLYSMEKSRDRTTVSVLLGLVRHESTPAAWRTRVLWLFRFAGGDADRLESVDS